jgi:hypothetical protein
MLCGALPALCMYERLHAVGCDPVGLAADERRMEPEQWKPGGHLALNVEFLVWSIETSSPPEWAQMRPVDWPCCLLQQTAFGSLTYTSRLLSLEVDRVGLEGPGVGSRLSMQHEAVFICLAGVR